MPLPLRWLLALLVTLGCAADRVDPHLPGDRCLYGCPDGLTCAGTTFPRGHANPGRCQLAPNRCLTDGDCRPRERCTRPDIGVCLPPNLL
jgi:hypothetical protein